MTVPEQNLTEEIRITCCDGVPLGGHFWPAAGDKPNHSVIINGATGVLARYYHRYAGFLAGHGFDVLTYDYRGIGLSKPKDLARCPYRWRDWGEEDFEAALRFMISRRRGGKIIVVGHSFGGFLPGLAESAPAIDRMLTVGAQYAWWGDYAKDRRRDLFLKWHVAMPIVTAVCGFFPGRRLGWLEDLPACVANEWSFRGRRFESSYPVSERQKVLDRMAAVTARILAVAVSDDELGTIAAIRRGLQYYGGEQAIVLLTPEHYGRVKVGHFGLFHDSHTDGFWMDTLQWLREERNPWPNFAVWNQSKQIRVSLRSEEI